jgi:5'-methylthioadenosine phosphorylase
MPPAPASPLPECPIAVIGGSGVYSLDGLEDIREVEVSTPYGKPSDQIRTGILSRRRVAFLPRHGRHHTLSPSEIPFRANIHALKQLGVRWLISLSAVGSLREKYAPGQFVIPLQFFDRTKNRDAQTFFGSGIVGHVSFGQPVCETLATILYQAASSEGVLCHWGGTYVNMEGPAFSTRAESEFHRGLGFDVVGMTNLAEAKLAREAEMSFATLSMVTDYDCWHQAHGEVSVGEVVQVMKRNTATAANVVRYAIPQIPLHLTTPSHKALKDAILTARAHWPEKRIEELRPLLQPYL